MMRKNTRLLLGMGLASGLLHGKSAFAQFPAPITADPIDNYTAQIASGDYGQVQTFSQTLTYDPTTFTSYPSVYWFKYVSDGKTAVKFDTLGSNFGTQGPS